jgi:hypothetical protein
MSIQQQYLKIPSRTPHKAPSSLFVPSNHNTYSEASQGNTSLYNLVTLPNEVIHILLPSLRAPSVRHGRVGNGLQHVEISTQFDSHFIQLLQLDSSPTHFQSTSGET